MPGTDEEQPAGGQPEPEPAAEATAPRRLTRQQKAAETRTRNRAEREKNQLEDSERILATGPRLSKARANDKIGEWTAPTRTRKRTISDTAPEPPAAEPAVKKKPRKSVVASKGARTKAKHGHDGKHERLPPSLFNHNHSGNESEERPLAQAARKPLAPKPVVKNAGKSRPKAAKPSLPEEDLKDWQSDDEKGHGGVSDSGEDENSSFIPSEESDSGQIDKHIETPVWTNGNPGKHIQSNYVHSDRATIVDNTDEEDALIPQVVDDRRDRRGSDASGVSMRTSSSAAPPPATTDEEDEPRNRGTHHSASRYDAYTDDDLGISGSEASFEMPDKIGNLPRGPISGMSPVLNTHRRTQGQTKSQSKRTPKVYETQHKSDAQHQRVSEPVFDRKYNKEKTRRDTATAPRVRGSEKSRRQVAAEAERPRFKEARDDRDHSSNRWSMHKDSRYDAENIAESSSDDRGPHHDPAAVIPSATESRWSKETRLVYTTRNKVNLKDQSPIIQRVIERLIKESIIDFAFKKAIHKTEERFVYQRDLLVTVANTLHASEVADRAKEDYKYATSLTNVAEGRLISLRGNMKKTANALVQHQYGLNGPDIGPRVSSLLYSCQWIFPGDVLKNQDYKNPFNIDLFTQLLATYFFDGSSSIAARSAGMFESSLRDKPHEKEIPESMIALVCAVTALALADWTSGVYTAPSDFAIALAEKYYDDVVTEIQSMKIKNIKMYHRVMHRVYTNVCSLRAGTPLMPSGSGPSKLILDE